MKIDVLSPSIVPPLISNAFSLTSLFPNCLIATYEDFNVPPRIVVTTSPLPPLVNESIAYAIVCPPRCWIVPLLTVKIP